MEGLQRSSRAQCKKPRFLGFLRWANPTNHLPTKSEQGGDIILGSSIPQNKQHRFVAFVNALYHEIDSPLLSFRGGGLPR